MYIHGHLEIFCVWYWNTSLYAANTFLVSSCSAFVFSCWIHTKPHTQVNKLPQLIDYAGGDELQGANDFFTPTYTPLCDPTFCRNAKSHGTVEMLWKLPFPPLLSNSGSEGCKSIYRVLIQFFHFSRGLAFWRREINIILHPTISDRNHPVHLTYIVTNQSYCNITQHFW